MSVPARQLLLSLLIAVFFAQTWLVYSDSAGRRDTLSPLALAGQEIWRKQNCQSCHQLYGYGGFLGPDLTNSIDGLSSERLDSILTVGSGQMPAFELPPEERTAITAFLRELHATGVSQPALGEVLSPAELMLSLVEADGQLAPEVARGWEIARTQNCIACHRPNEASQHLALDLTTITSSVSRERIFEVLRDGIPGKAMPRLALTPADCEAVHAYLCWMNERGETIRRRFQNLSSDGRLDLTALPWFEYQ